MKNLVREIHRRSLWQVLGIYLAVSWIVLQVVDVVGNNFGLPDWVAPAALVLLLLGLPVVIATAFVQEGMTTREPEEREQSLADVGEMPPPPAPEVEGHHKLFTWKNALVGGGVAFALLGVLTAGYLFMRTAGIGPAGTLVAQGILEEGAEAILAEFQSADPDLADVVTGALRIDLGQSPTIDLVPRSELSAALRRMQREEDSPITSAVARELAVREGYPAIIEGEIGTAGSGYVLTASIVGGEAWEPLAGFRATAKGDDDLIDAIEALSRDIRDKAGESLRSVQAAPGLRQVSTTSLEALRLYTRGETLENSDELGAVDFYKQAVEIDPEFAMAYRKIGVGLGNLGVRRAEAVEALTRAFELKDRLPPAERYLAEAYYYSNVEGDRIGTIRAYERLLEVAPDDIAGLNNLALVYMDVGRLGEAEALLERAIEVEDFFVAFANLADARRDMGAADAANEALDLALTRLPASESRIEHDRVRGALDDADYETAELLSAAFGERFRSRDDVGRRAVQGAMVAGTRGRIREALGYLDDAEGTPIFEGHPMRVAEQRARLTLVLGDSAAAAIGLIEAYESRRDSLSALDRIYGWWLPTLVEAGAVSEAERIYEEWRREVPDEHLGLAGRDGRRRLDARLAHARGDYDVALALWEAHADECGGACAMEASLGIAAVHEARGDLESALGEFERFLERPASFRAFLDLGQRARVLERLGALNEERGDVEAAIRYYSMFVELWSRADDGLQPGVSAARSRLVALGASQ